MAASDMAERPERVGPPLLILGLGFLSWLVSGVLIPIDADAAHVLGYLTGALIPIVITGLARRIDLDRRRSPFYAPKRAFGTGLVVLAALAVVAAGLHVWPLATGLAS